MGPCSVSKLSKISSPVVESWNPVYSGPWVTLPTGTCSNLELVLHKQEVCSFLVLPFQKQQLIVVYSQMQCLRTIRDPLKKNPAIYAWNHILGSRDCKINLFFFFLTKDNLILKSLNCLQIDFLFCLLLLLFLMKGRHNEQPSFHLSFCRSIFVEGEHVSLAHLITEKIGGIWL